ncbi:phosphatase PAP2 family protein [Pseudoxanthomonas sp. LH2527]|uniref:phosphatase PAP2 family protein n=1 Tax=Pseudoxanthomonas sp. LH2527 TaxID=2923249 RepID=UPI001F13606A|nr:phosphatase PAP2 family protein [Pseudoxanthomonas sp. LH2527]MCH6482863.1 phosphatase PAP2 family protein [Pseudoxanthomonas sp. LH2527]
MSASPTSLSAFSGQRLPGLLPVSLILLAAAWMAAQSLDQPWASWLFHQQGDTWSLKRDFMLETVLHRSGRLVSQLAWAGVLMATLAYWRTPSAHAWTRPAARLLVSVLASTACVAWLKATTHMDCPWDLVGFGGERPFVPLFAHRPVELGTPACFPAAHAAGGYAWVALYFFCLHAAPRWRHAGLGAGLLAGIVFGLAQQLRGAHFLSHDIASLAICWAVACSVDRIGTWFASRSQGQDRA